LSKENLSFALTSLVGTFVVTGIFPLAKQSPSNEVMIIMCMSSKDIAAPTPLSIHHTYPIIKFIGIFTVDETGNVNAAHSLTV
jgi:hypothetical protein